MHRPRMIQLICLALAAISMVTGGLIQERLSESRSQLEIQSGFDMASSRFPELALLQVMPGGLRALAVDYLWIRSQTLQQQGRVYDAQDLAKMICQLQPRYPTVWAFHSWNLAWNISVTKHQPIERWKDITAGIVLLRDSGIVYNPNALLLYQELARIYFDKIGGTTDEMHIAYKSFVAAEYHRVLGAPPHTGGTKEALAWLQPIVDAPTSPEALLADPAVAKFVADLAGCGVKLDLSLLEAYNDWSGDSLVGILGQPKTQPRDDREKQLRDLLTDPALAKPCAAAVAFARRNVLVNTYKLDPNWMRELTTKYGPIDWRLTWAHSLYWSTFGVHHCKGVDVLAISSLNTDRYLMNSLKGMSIYGRLTLQYNPRDPSMPQVYLGPDWRFIEPTNQEYAWMGKYVEGNSDGRTYEQFKDGHINYLSDMISELWQLGRVDKAQQLLDFVRTTYKPRDPKWNQPLDEWVMFTFTEESSPRESVWRNMVLSALARAYIAMAADFPEDYETSMGRAQGFWEQFESNKTTPDRTRMRTFLEMQSMAAMQVIVDASPMGLGTLEVLTSSSLYGRLPLPIQQQIYDGLVYYKMPERCEAQGLDFAKAFPEPAGVEEVRKLRAEAQSVRDVTGVPREATTPAGPGGQ